MELDMYFDDFRLVYEENSLCCFNCAMYSGYYSRHSVFRSRKEKTEITSNWHINYNKKCGHQRRLTRTEISTSAQCLKKKKFFFSSSSPYSFFLLNSISVFFFSLCLFQSACVFLLSCVCVCVFGVAIFSFFSFRAK